LICCGTLFARWFILIDVFRILLRLLWSCTCLFPLALNDAWARSGFPSVWEEAAKLEKQWPDPEKRIQTLTRALYRTDAPKSRAIIWLALAQAYEQTGNATETCLSYAHYTRLSPRDVKGWLKLAETSEGLKQWNMAQTAWKSVAHLSEGQESQNAFLKQDVAAIRLKLQQSEETSDLLLLLGDKLLALKEWQEARTWYKQAMERDPTLFAAWWGYGMTCQQAGDYEEADEVWKRMLHLPIPHELRRNVSKKSQELDLLARIRENETPELLAGLAAFRIDEGNYRDAISLLDKAIQGEERSDWLQARAICLERVKNWEQAAIAWQRVQRLETDPATLEQAGQRWVQCSSRRIESLRNQGEFILGLLFLENLQGDARFPASNWHSLREQLLGHALVFRDSFLMGNVDVHWERERGAWLIQRGRLEGSDGRIWIKKELRGPVILTAEIEMDTQYPGQPGIFLCAHPGSVEETGYHLLWGTSRQKAVLFRAGKPVTSFPNLTASPGQRFVCEIQAWQNSIRIYKDGALMALFQDDHALWRPSSGKTVAGLVARSGIVYFDEVKVYQLK